MQQMLSSIPPAKLKEDKANLKERITYVKSKLGWINHGYTNAKPQYKKVNIVVNLSNIQGNDTIPL
jgi:hypothetical protein